MSYIDERVVEMQFNNKDFEKNVATSLNTLDKLQAALKLDGSQKGLEELQKTSNSFKLDPLLTAVENVNNKFTAMGIVGTTALVNITNKAINAGEALIKSLSVDNIAAGWEKFGEKTTSVGTLVNQGFDLSEVERQMERLNWFTDETSYNFTDMVSNISKFTATGKDLEESVTAMEGIALWAAASGQNATKASMAMYQLSQAMGKGVLKFDDWKSIQNASMDTVEFRKQAIEAAKALGKVKEVGDEVYEIVGAKKPQKFSLADMFTSDALSKQQWFTDDVMMKVFQRYDQASVKIKSYIDAQRELGRDLTASQAIDELGDQIDELSKKWFLSGQEARTWGDVVSSVKDAVSTGWMNTFEAVFGNYEEATELFSNLAETLYEIFSEGGNARNQVLQLWKALGGRDILLETVATLFNNLAEGIGALQDGFHSFLVEDNPATKINETFRAQAISLANFGVALLELVSKTKFTETALKSLYEIGRGLYSAFSIVKTLFKDLLDIFSPLVLPLNLLAGYFLEVVGAIANGVTAFDEFLKSSQGVANVVSALRSGVDIFAKVISYAAFGIELFVKNLVSIARFASPMAKISSLASKTGNAISFMATKLEFVNAITAGLQKVMLGFLALIYVVATNFAEMFSSENAEKAFDRLSTLANNTTTRIINILNLLGSKLGPLFNMLSNLVAGFFLSLAYGFNNLKSFDAIGALETVIDAFLSTIEKAITLVGVFVSDLDGVASPLELLQTLGTNTINVLTEMTKTLAKMVGFKDNIESAKKGLQGFFETIFGYASQIDIAKIALLGFGASVSYALFKVGSAMSGAKKMFDSFSKIPDLLEKAFNGYFKNTPTKALLDVAKAIGILAASLVALSLVDATRLAASVAILVLLGAGLAALSVGIKKFGNDSGFDKNAKGLVAVAGSMFILSAAFVLLDSIDFDHLLQDLVVLTAFGAGLVVVSKFLKAGAGASLKSAIVLFMFAASINKMVGAFTNLQNGLKASTAEETLQTLITLVMGVMAVSYAASKISLGSALILVAVVGVLTMVLRAVQALIEANVPAGMVIGVFATVTALIVLFGLIAKLISKGNTVGVGVKVVLNVISPILALAGALLLVVMAFEKLGEFGIGLNGKTIGSVIGMIALMAALVILLKKTEGLEGPAYKAGVAALAIGAAIYILSNAVLKISEVPEDAWIKTAVLFGLIAYAFSKLMEASAATEKANTAAILSMAAVIGVIAIAIALLTNLDVGKAIGVSVGLAAVFWGLGQTFAGISEATDQVKPAVAVAFLLVVGFISSALMVLANMPVENALAAGVVVGGVLFVLAKAVEIMAEAAVKAKDAIKGAASIAIMAVSLIAAAASLSMLASFNPVNVIVSALALVGIMTALVAASKFAQDAIMAAVSLVIMSGSLVLAANAIKTIAELDPDSLKQAGIALGAVLLAFAALSLVGMTPLADGMIIIAAALTVFGFALLEIAAAAYLFSSAVMTITTALIMLSSMSTESVQQLAQNLPIMMQALGEGVAEGISAFVSTILTNLIGAIGAILQAILEKGPEFISTGIELIKNFIIGMVSCAGQAIQAVVDIIVSIVQFVMSFINSFISLGAGIISALATGIANGITLIINCFFTVMSAVVQVVGAYISGFVEIGKQFVEGIVNGIVDGATYLFEKAKELATGLLDAVKQTLGIASPSKEGEILGNFFDMGVGDGVTDLIPYVNAAGADMGSNLLETVGQYVNAENGAAQGAEYAGAVANAVKEGLAGLPSIPEGALDIGAGGDIVKKWQNQMAINEINNRRKAKKKRDEQARKDAKKAQAKREKKNKDPLEDLLGDVGKKGGKGGSGGSGSSGKSGTEKAEKEFDKLTKIMDYADKEIGIFNNHWALGLDTLGNVEPMQASKDALELLALQLYETSLAGETADDRAKRMAKSTPELLEDVKKAYKDYRDEVKKTVDGQVDMFKMFDFGKKIRPEEMIKNQKSNLRAITEYAQNIETLTERGLSKDILQNFGKRGLNALADMGTLIQMNDEQFKQFNEDWMKAGKMIDDVTNRYMSSLAFVNAGSQEGFKQTLDPVTGEETGTLYMQSVLDGMRKTAGLNLQDGSGVSEATKTIAEGLAKGVSETLGSSSEASAASKASEELGTAVTDSAESKMSGAEAESIGKNLCEGIAKGIRDNMSEAINAAVEMATAALQAAKDALGIASPSKAFEDLGYYSDLGLSGGLTKYGTIVREAAADTATSAVDEMSGVFGRIADIIDGNIDLDPTIRPVLDLTNLQYGATQIGSLLGLNDPYALNAVAGITGIQNDASLMAGLTGSLTDAINSMKKDQETPQVTINIYPQEGQSAEEIAEEVSWRLNHDVFKRRAVYGGT